MIFIRKFLAVLVLVCFILNSAGCVKSYQIHPDFKQRHKEIFSASVMLPEVDVFMLTFKGDRKRMHELIPLIEESTVAELKSVLDAKGYIVRELDLSEDVLKADPDLRTALFNVQKVFLKRIDDISKQKKKEFRYSVGSEVNMLAEEANCDILIFVKEEGMKKSAGEIAKDMVKAALVTAAFALIGGIHIPTTQVSAMMVHIAVVDANDGEILWYTNNSLNTNWDPANQKQVKSLIRSLFKPFPASVNKGKAFEGPLLKQAEELPEKVSSPAGKVTPVMVKPAAI